jgi:hypothetical protein
MALSGRKAELNIKTPHHSWSKTSSSQSFSVCRIPNRIFLPHLPEQRFQRRARLLGRDTSLRPRKSEFRDRRSRGTFHSLFRPKNHNAGNRVQELL